MSWIDSKRIIRSGFLNFWRNGIVSVASLLVATITLSVITSLILLQAVLHFSLEQIQNKVDVTIYMTNNAPEDKILDLKASLEKLPEVTAVTYTSSEQALENFKNLHQDDFLTLQALNELDENPLGASLNVKAEDTSQYESITNFLETGPVLSNEGTSIIDKVNYHQNKLVIDRLTSIINGAQKLGFIVTLILVLISIVITFNTIRLTIYFAREEIGVMRLVGAENKYIRGPFMVEGILYGSIASVLTLILYIPITFWLGRNMTGFFGMNLFTYYLNNIFQVFIIILFSGVILGAVSSFLAVRKYLTK
ncbi:MAG: ABC transporter permease [Candidatus Pacebacteria bacterium]|nr:ABC transporter permease [Candidatus Paceibacterota bacterium]MBP9772971.1 ABC transporter permease [Candidatus Paceibacterota bacterium]